MSSVFMATVIILRSMAMLPRTAVVDKGTAECLYMLRRTAAIERDSATHWQTTFTVVPTRMRETRLYEAMLVDTLYFTLSDRQKRRHRKSWQYSAQNKAHPFILELTMAPPMGSILSHQQRSLSMATQPACEVNNPSSARSSYEDRHGDSDRGAFGAKANAAVGALRDGR